MILIIAEKPSLARNIAAAIGDMKNRQGYMEGKEYLITWVFGHLFSLADIEHYSPAPEGVRGWTFDNLPCFPKTFDYELRGDDGVRRQFELISTLCNRPDVTAIVNAGDADREGEIIVRTCVRKALRTEKPQLRLWLPDQTPQTVRTALSEMEPDAAYDNLANEGYARTYIDWLWGVNLTRYASIISGKLLRVGRVIVPIVKAIYDRDRAIREFQPRTYYGVVSRTEVRGEEVVLTSKEEFDTRDGAAALASIYNGLTTIVTDKKSREDILHPGKLYSLSTLQNVLGRKYKMSMKEALDTVQALYEKGYLTYPRTNSEYLATAEKGKIRQILEGVARLGYPVAFRDSKHIFDDSKIESHSALTPTYKIPKTQDLTEREAQVYSTVFRRFVAVFCAQPCRVEKTEIHIMTGDREEFVLKGMAIIEPGWTKYDDYNKKDKFLPKLEVGEVLVTAFAPVEKQTTPPKHYTIETLNNYLKNPFKEDKAMAERAMEDGLESDEEDYRAIFEGLELGTEATRTGIIDNARNSKYIDLTKDTYTILPDGEFLIEALLEMGIDMDKYKTSQMGQALKKVYHGLLTVEESTALAEAEILEVFSHREEIMEKRGNQGHAGDDIGECPICKNRVVRTTNAYECQNEGCTFRIGLQICRRPILVNEVREIIETGRTQVLNGFVSKNFKRFSCALVLRDGKVVFDLEESHDGEAVDGCKCPVCGKKMVYQKFTYACSVKKCGFHVGRTILGRKITPEELKVLCDTGISPLLEGFVSKTDGKVFSAHLVLREGEAKIVPPQTSGQEIPHDEPKKAAPRRKTASPDGIGKCPLCGERIVKGKQNWGCMGFVHGCTLRIPFVWRGHEITETEAKALITKGKTSRRVSFTGGEDYLVLQAGIVRAAGQEGKK